MTVNILQFGTSGQLGRELLDQAKDFDVSLIALSREEADFTDPERMAELVDIYCPDLVVIAAAYTAVDRAESEPEVAQTVNAETPAAIARFLKPEGAALVMVSTDYVFSGDKGAPYVEEDATGPINVYGATKLEGERAVLAACPRALVIRTSWVVSSHGKNFIKTMLRLAGEGAPMRVVADQVGRPTAARDLARFILSQAERLSTAMAGDPAFGVVHFANTGEVSWRDLAQTVVELAMGKAAPTVQGIPTVDYPTPARRPLRASMDTGKLAQVFGVTPRPWREAVAEIVAELAAEQRSAA
jgi:dTDP-4-dehydrorhamnose reductase